MFRHGLLLASVLVLATAVAAKDPVWLRLEGSKFTVFSDASEKDTRAWAAQFAMFHEGVRSILHVQEADLQPVTVVLFRSDREMRPYKPLEDGKPAAVAGFFSRTPLGNFIEAADEYDYDDVRHVIFHESVHWLAHASDVSLPLWLDEGLAEALSTFRTDGKSYMFGEALQGHVNLLNRERLIPLRELVNIEHGSLLYNETQRTSIFYAESWAFVHYLVFSDRMAQAQKFNQLVRALNAGTDPEAAFEQVFGIGSEAMQKRLEAYLRHGSYAIAHYPFDRAKLEQGFAVRPAMLKDVAFARDRILCAVGRAKESVPRFTALAEAEPGNVLAWEALGCAHYSLEEYPQTEECFRKAAALGSENAFVYSYLGDMAMGLSPNGVTVSTLSPDGARDAADSYEKALGLDPGDAHAYHNIAALSSVLDMVTKDDERILVQGVRRYPKDLMLQVGVGIALLKTGRDKDALPFLKRVADDPRPEDRDAAVYARAVAENFEFRTVENRIRELATAGDFEGVVIYIDEVRKTHPGDRLEAQIASDRKTAASLLALKKAQDLLREGKSADARLILADALEQTDDGALRDRMASAIKAIDDAGQPSVR